jgi:hypothetical protein
LEKKISFSQVRRENGIRITVGNSSLLSIKIARIHAQYTVLSCLALPEMGHAPLSLPLPVQVWVEMDYSVTFKCLLIGRSTYEQLMATAICK